mmetsp:Transcript_38467/g.84527  ORF Transcript_38467/g.84527 Transcript_38467/m.84527 type:complete len:209 (-) Transcript_38467:94-720(-)
MDVLAGKIDAERVVADGGGAVARAVRTIAFVNHGPFDVLRSDEHHAEAVSAAHPQIRKLVARLDVEATVRACLSDVERLAVRSARRRVSFVRLNDERESRAADVFSPARDREQVLARKPQSVPDFVRPVLLIDHLRVGALRADELSEKRLAAAEPNVSEGISRRDLEARLDPGHGVRKWLILRLRKQADARTRVGRRRKHAHAKRRAL